MQDYTVLIDMGEGKEPITRVFTAIDAVNQDAVWLRLIRQHKIQSAGATGPEGYVLASIPRERVIIIEMEGDGEQDISSGKDESNRGLIATPQG